jgi:hypothetical protein
VPLQETLFRLGFTNQDPNRKSLSTIAPERAESPDYTPLIAGSNKFFPRQNL